MTITVTMTLRPNGLNPLDGLAGVITQVECRFVASDDAGACDASVYEAVPLGSPNPAAFTPFDTASTDYALMLGWVQAAKGDGYAAWKSDCEALATAALSAPVAITALPVAPPA